MSDETDLIVKSVETIAELLTKDAATLEIKTTEELQRTAQV